MGWCVWWAFLEVQLEETYEASLVVGSVGVVNDYLLSWVSTPEAARMVLGCILSVFEIWSLSWVLHNFYLAWLSPQLPVPLPTPESKVDAIIEDYCVQ